MGVSLLPWILECNVLEMGSTLQMTTECEWCDTSVLFLVEVDLVSLEIATK